MTEEEETTIGPVPPPPPSSTDPSRHHSPPPPSPSPPSSPSIPSPPPPQSKSLPSVTPTTEEASVIPPFKKQKRLVHESLYLDNLPSSPLYERSLMHRDIVNGVYMAPITDFLITTSIDGHVKFWKKTSKGIEFVKHFRAHLGPIVASNVSYDGAYFVSVSSDKTLKVFDVINFDMINIINLGFLPGSVTWIYQKGNASLSLAVSDKESSCIHIFDGRSGENGIPTFSIPNLHSRPIKVLAYNPVEDIVVSIDEGGMMEYWNPKELDQGGVGQPKPPKISWELKSETDLYEFKKVNL